MSLHILLFEHKDWMYDRLGTEPDLTYVILDLGCTKSMGSRYAVNKNLKSAHVRGLDYELIPSTSRFSLANSETTSVHQAYKNWFQTQPPMFTIVDIVEQGRVPILFSLQQMTKTADASGYAS